MLALRDSSGGAQILDARVGAGTDEHLVDLDLGDRRVRFQPHVVQRALRPLALHRIAHGRRVGHAPIHRHHHFRRRAPGHLRLDLRGIQLNHFIELRVRIAVQRAPVSHRIIPCRTLRCERATLEVIDGGVVRRDHARTCARLDRHVAQRHAPFHRQAAYRAAGKLDRVTGAARRADPADHRQRDVLRSHAPAELTLDHHLHGLGFFHQQTLRRHHMLDLGGADAERQRGERAVGAGMRIAAHHRHARQGRALLRPDHMHDALAHVVHFEFVHAKLGAIAVQRLHLQARDRVGDALRAPGSRHVVIGYREDRSAAPQLAPGQLQALKSLRAGHFMHQMAVDINQRGAVGFLPHHVSIPEFVVKSLRAHVVPLFKSARLCHNRHGLAASGPHWPGKNGGDYCFTVGLPETCRLAVQRRLLKLTGKSVSMFAALLYRIHCPVRRLDQALNVSCALRIQRNSDAGG